MATLVSLYGVALLPKVSYGRNNFDALSYNKSARILRESYDLGLGSKASYDSCPASALGLSGTTGSTATDSGGIYKNFQYLYEWHSSVTALVQPNIWLYQGALRVHFG